MVNLWGSTSKPSAVDLELFEVALTGLTAKLTSQGI